MFSLQLEVCGASLHEVGCRARVTLIRPEFKSRCTHGVVHSISHRLVPAIRNCHPQLIRSCHPQLVVRLILHPQGLIRKGRTPLHSSAIRTVSPQVTKILVYSIADVVQSVAIEVDDYLCITEVSDYLTLVIYEYRS